MDREILVECFKSNNLEFVEGTAYKATVSNQDLQTFIINMQNKLYTELREDVEFVNGEFDGDRCVGFRVDPSIFEQKLELVLKLDNGKIINNAEKLKAMLSEKGNKYSYVVDDSNYEQAKTDRASLNKLSDTIAEKRKALEADLVKEWTPIKKDLMECEKLVKGFGLELGNGIATIDDEKKNEKKEEIKQAFLEIDFTALGYEPIDFKLVWDSKWANASTSKKKWQEELQAKIDKIKQDFTMLQYFLPTDEVEIEQITQVYTNTLDLGRAKCKADELLKLHEKVAEKKQETFAGQAYVEPVPPIATEVPSIPTHTEKVEEELYTRAFRVVGCTRKQIIDLGDYMNANGIKFEKVEEN